MMRLGHQWHGVIGALLPLIYHLPESFFLVDMRHVLCRYCRCFRGTKVQKYINSTSEQVSFTGVILVPRDSRTGYHEFNVVRMRGIPTV